MDTGELVSCCCCECATCTSPTVMLSLFFSFPEQTPSLSFPQHMSMLISMSGRSNMIEESSLFGGMALIGFSVGFDCSDCSLRKSCQPSAHSLTPSRIDVAKLYVRSDRTYLLTPLRKLEMGNTLNSLVLPSSVMAPNCNRQSDASKSIINDDEYEQYQATWKDNTLRKGWSPGAQSWVDKCILGQR